MDLRYHKHRALAGHIVALIRGTLAEDPDICISLYKIKAHNGRIGNECADRIAKRATHKCEDLDSENSSGENPEKQYNRPTRNFDLPESLVIFAVATQGSLKATSGFLFFSFLFFSSNFKFR